MELVKISDAFNELLAPVNGIIFNRLIPGVIILIAGLLLVNGVKRICSKYLYNRGSKTCSPGNTLTWLDEETLYEMLQDNSISKSQTNNQKDSSRV